MACPPDDASGAMRLTARSGTDECQYRAVAFHAGGTVRTAEIERLLPPAQITPAWLPRQTRRERAGHRSGQASPAHRNDPGPGRRITDDEATRLQASNSACPDSDRT